MKIAVCRNREREESLAIQSALCEALAKEGVDFYLATDALLPQTDILCVLGGDGTLFAYAHLALAMDIPIWFINAGSVGFLAESSEDLPARAAQIAARRYTIAERDLLEVKAGDARYTALNDACLMRDTSRLQTVTLTATTCDETVARYRGDGALVCTPMGSTGYAFSAGAPIVAPDGQGMLFVPIAAHSLSARPVLFGPSAVLTLSCQEGAELFVDGVNRSHIGDVVEVRLSQRKVRFVLTEKPSFFAKISTKLL